MARIEELPQPTPHTAHAPAPAPAAARADGAATRIPVPAARRRHRLRPWLILAGIALVVVVALSLYHPAGDAGAAARGGGPVPVTPGTVQAKDVPIYLTGIGTVQAFNTVTVHSRVDGQLQRVAFTEGQDVKEGDVLAVIDPAPFQTALDQAIGKQGQDQAQLANARLDMARDTEMLARKVISSQQYDTQKALVDQLAATVAADVAAVASARVQLDYATIHSPLAGRTGIRQIDQGNIIHAADAGGLVTITQLQPISVLFTLPEQNLRLIHQQSTDGRGMAVVAVGRDDNSVLDRGEVAVVNNEIDSTTGTIQIKATFPNAHYQLWPGQFVNARLLLTTRKGGLVVPAQAVQNGPDGSFVYAIQPDQTVQIRAVKVGQTEAGQTLIDSGLKEGNKIVVDGQYKLQPGSKIQAAAAEGGSGAGAGHAHQHPSPGAS